MQKIAQIIYDHFNGKKTNKSKEIISKIKNILIRKGFKSPIMFKRIAKENGGEYLFENWKQRVYRLLDIIDLHDSKLFYIHGLFKKDFGLNRSPESVKDKYQKILDEMDENELEERTASKVNPWAVCNTTVDKEKDPEKYEKCVLKIKKKNKEGKK